MDIGFARRYSRAAALLLLLALTGACGSDTDDAKRPGGGPEAELFDEAADEGELLVYSTLQDQLNASLGEGYEAEVGLPLTVEKIAGASIDTRYETEAAADAVRADILITTNCEFVEAQIEKGVMVDMLEADVPSYPGSYPDEFMFADGAVPIIQMNPYGIGANTDKVSEGEIPTSWDDLLDPKWTGKILMVSPSSSASQMQMWHYLIETHGEDFARDLQAQAAQFFPSTGPAAEALGAGEGALLIPTAGQVTATLAAVGAPVAYEQPEDTTTSYLCVGLSEDGPSPQSARLFLDYLLSEAGSEAINGDAAQGTVGPFGIGAALPAGLVPPARVTEAVTTLVNETLGQ